MVDTIKLIPILKQICIGDHTQYKNNNPKNPKILSELGYKYDRKLSFETSLVFYNKNKKK